MRQNVHSGIQWERRAAYCRGVKVGSFIAIAGTVAFNERDELVGEGDAYEQIAFIFRKIEATLAKLGASMKDVVRTRTFMTDIDQYPIWERAHKKAFDGIDPVATCIGNAVLMDPRLFAEIEVDAILSD